MQPSAQRLVSGNGVSGYTAALVDAVTRMAACLNHVSNSLCICFSLCIYFLDVECIYILCFNIIQIAINLFQSHHYYLYNFIQNMVYSYRSN